MQKKKQEVRDSSIEEMDRLIKTIRSANPLIQEKELAVQLGYGKGYFSECRSRNFAPDKLLKSLRTQILALQNTNKQEPTPGAKEEPFDNLTALIRNNTKLSDAIYDAVQMLKKRDEQLEQINASLAMVQPNMIALTAKIQEGQREVLAEMTKKLDSIAAGMPRSSKSLHHEQP